jgi:hypothetical protein
MLDSWSNIKEQASGVASKCEAEVSLLKWQQRMGALVKSKLGTALP